jgi:hypothetical protein
MNARTFPGSEKFPGIKKNCAVSMCRATAIVMIELRKWRDVETSSREPVDMRQIIAAAAFAAMAFAAAPASAHDYPWCLQGREYGLPGLCQFTSYQQCQATASGTFSYCGANPRFAFGLQQPQRRSSYQGW